MRVVFKGPVFSIESGLVDEPGGVRARRDIIRHSGSVAVLPVDQKGRVTLIRQYRCAFAKSVIEIPAGRIDKGETPLQAAKRELREEVGLGARKWERLAKILPTPGFCDETVTVFRATSLFESFAEADPDERIEILRLPFDEAIRLLTNGKIDDAKSVVALLMEQRRKRRAPKKR